MTPKEVQEAKEALGAQAEDCAKGQHVLYDFLIKLSKVSADVKAIDQRVLIVEQNFGEGMKEVREDLKEVKDMVKPLHAVWGKVKSGALVVLAAYFLKDTPELLKPVLAVLAK